jgi:PPOX class probable F420-dependent enzyme
MARNEMMPDETRAFLEDGTRTGKLATTRADGSPHVVPIWFVFDGDDLIFTTWHQSAKGRNLARDPRASLCVDDQTPPYSFVTLFGTVTLSNDLDALRSWATRIGARYMGADRAEEFGQRNAVEGELLARLHVTKTVAHRDVSN